MRKGKHAQTELPPCPLGGYPSPLHDDMRSFDKAQHFGFAFACSSAELKGLAIGTARIMKLPIQVIYDVWNSVEEMRRREAA